MFPSTAPCSPLQPFQAPLLLHGPCAGETISSQALLQERYIVQTPLLPLRRLYSRIWATSLLTMQKHSPPRFIIKPEMYFCHPGLILHAPCHPSLRDSKPQHHGGAITISHPRVCTAKCGRQLVSSPKNRCRDKFCHLPRAELLEGSTAAGSAQKLFLQAAIHFGEEQMSHPTSSSHSDIDSVLG